MNRQDEFPVERFFFYQTAALSIFFLLAPLFPQMMSEEFTFGFRSICLLLLVGNGAIFGWKRCIQTLRQHPLSIPLLLILILCFAGSLYSPDIYRAKHKTAMLLTAFILFWLGILVSKKPSDLYPILAGLALSGLLAAGFAVWQQWLGHGELIHTLQTQSVYPDDMQRELMKTLRANRAMGAFGNPNHLAGYLVLSFWSIWLCFQLFKHTFLRILLFCAGLFVCYAVYQTFSRSGLGILLLSLIGFALYPYLQQSRRIPMWVVWLAIAFVAATGIAIYLFKDSLLGGRLLVSSTLIARWHFFRGGLLIIQHHPWFGVGTEGYESYFSALLRPGDLESRYVHNIVLEYALEWGIAGLFALGFLAITCIRFFFTHLWTECSSHCAITYAALGSLACLLLASLVDFHDNLMEMLIAPMFLSGVALHASLQPNETGNHDSKRVSYIAFGTSILLWLVFIALPFGNRLNRENGHYLTLDGQYAAARSSYQWALLFDWTDAESHNHLGYLWNINPTMSSKISMLESMQRAVDWAPRRAAFRADLADAYFALGYTERAVEEMKTAQALFPARPAYHERLADIYRNLGDETRAQSERNEAERLKRLIEERKL